jgi:hypothetical protein
MGGEEKAQAFKFLPLLTMEERLNYEAHKLKNLLKQNFKCG